MTASGRSLPNYGGQAVIEGVLMRGSQAYAIAVRAPDQSIQTESQPLGRLYRSRLMRLPFLRGLLILWDSLALGIRALTYSANVQAVDESERIEGASLTLTLLGSLAVGIGAFILLPAGTAHLVQLVTGASPLATNLVEGLVRLLLLIGYIWSIGRVPEIKRVFGYHAAEHMTIHAYEDGAELTVEQIARYPRAHPRCGTAFLLTVVVFSVVVFSLLGPMPLAARLGSRLLLIPVLAALSYEYLRLTARFSHLAVVRPLIWPNLALQQLTTRPPEDSMIEVAIASFRRMRQAEATGAPD